MTGAWWQTTSEPAAPLTAETLHAAFEAIERQSIDTGHSARIAAAQAFRAALPENLRRGDPVIEIAASLIAEGIPVGPSTAARLGEYIKRHSPAT